MHVYMLQYFGQFLTPFSPLPIRPGKSENDFLHVRGRADLNKNRVVDFSGLVGSSTYRETDTLKTVRSIDALNVGLIGTPIGSATRSSVPLVGRIRIASLSSAMTGCLKSGKAFDYWRIR
jgi:hypothetical protein